MAAIISVKKTSKKNNVDRVPSESVIIEMKRQRNKKRRSGGIKINGRHHQSMASLKWRKIVIRRSGISGKRVTYRNKLSAHKGGSTPAAGVMAKRKVRKMACSA